MHIDLPGSKPLSALMAAVAATALILSADTPASAADTHPDTGETLADNQTFTYRMSNQFPTLDPQLIEDWTGFHVILDLFEGLLNQDSNGELVPGVATHFEASDGGMTYTFALRDDARWSNGDAVTAHDFVYAWQRAVDPATASPYGWYVELAGIENAGEILASRRPPADLGVSAVDENTLEVRLNEPRPYFPAMTTFATLFPVHRPTIEAYGADWTAPGNLISNGAYMLSELIPDEYNTRTRNSHYWGADTVIIDQVTGRVIKDADQAMNLYRDGRLDHLEPLPIGQFPALRDELPDEATSVPQLCSYYYLYNHSGSGNPALRDARVRKALSLAIDRDKIVNELLKGGQSPAYTFTHPKTAGFTAPGIAYAQLSQDERDAEAQRLFTDTRLEDLTLRLIFNESESHTRIANAISRMWEQKLGIRTEHTSFEWNDYLDARTKQQFDVARAGWCGDYNEASTFLELFTTAHAVNDGKYSNERVDELMQASRKAEDPGAVYAEVERILADDMAMAPIYHYANTFLLRADIKGWPYDNVQGLWYSKDLYRVTDGSR